ncbi:unnamed protein product [Victoria cruziana]
MCKRKAFGKGSHSSEAQEQSRLSQQRSRNGLCRCYPKRISKAYLRKGNARRDKLSEIACWCTHSRGQGKHPSQRQGARAVRLAR